MSLAAVVILFYPDVPTLTRNINSYLEFVDKLYLVNNSYDERKHHEFDISEVEEKFGFGKVEIISNHNNLGVGEALNIGLSKCISEGFDFLLTMDQDSYFYEKDAKLFFEQFRVSQKEGIGIFSPLHGDNKEELYQIAKNTSITMTSGNIVDVQIAIKIGGFNQDFFIDHIDHDFCLRLQKKGYKINFSSARLEHELGSVRLLFGFKYVHHSPYRFYYFMRNGLFTSRIFPVFRTLFIKRAIFELIKLLVFELKIIETSRYTKRAISDFLHGKMGKFENE